MEDAGKGSLSLVRSDMPSCLSKDIANSYAPPVAANMLVGTMYGPCVDHRRPQPHRVPLTLNAALTKTARAIGEQSTRGSLIVSLAMN